jgi:hypothetical protein
MAARLLLAPLAAAALLLAAACGDSEAPQPPGDREVLFSIPWTAPERFEYLIESRAGVTGSGTFTLSEEDGVLTMTQAYVVPSEEVRDTVTVEADPQTLRPVRVKRVIDGPRGTRECVADYGAETVTVEQRTDDDTRTDVLDLPERAYDTWGDLFLWRTLDFQNGFRIAYRDVLTCSLARPDVITVELEVRGTETVEVPAGSFETWRMDIRSGGETQRAWYSTGEERLLVRYDNNQQVFELVSYE